MKYDRPSPPLDLDPLRAFLASLATLVVFANLVVGGLFWIMWYHQHYVGKDPSRVCPNAPIVRELTRG